MSFECYAQRLLNPFRGSVHTMRYYSAEAMTTDGVHWDIYVANTILLPEEDGVQEVQVGDMRYGSWSAEQGLRRGRLSPSADFRRTSYRRYGHDPGGTGRSGDAPQLAAAFDAGRRAGHLLYRA